MKKQLLYLLALSLIFTASNSLLSEKLALENLNQSLSENKGVSELIEYKDFQKTNGRTENIMGDKLYHFEYKVLTVAKQDLHKCFNFIELRIYLADTSQLFKGYKKREVVGTIKGVMYLVNAEKGWVWDKSHF